MKTSPIGMWPFSIKPYLDNGDEHPFLRAAIMHDYLYLTNNSHPREDVDDAFLVDCIKGAEQSMNPSLWQRYAVRYYYLVRVLGFAPWHFRRLRNGLMTSEEAKSYLVKEHGEIVNEVLNDGGL